MGKIEEIIAKNARRRRESLNLGQKEVAKRSNLSVQTISKIENARRQARKKNYEELARALEWTVSDLQMAPQAEAKPVEYAAMAALNLDLAKKVDYLQAKLNALKSHPVLAAFEKARQFDHAAAAGVVALLGLPEALALPDHIDKPVGRAHRKPSSK